MKKICFLLSFLFIHFNMDAQDNSFTSQLYSTYNQYKETSLDKRRIKHQDLQPLIQRLEGKSGIEVKQVGRSIEGRSLSLISLGEGPVDVFLWSQMHGDEPTATQAIFDILNFFTAKSFAHEKARILENIRMHFLPMLNPDGAEVFQRRNTLGIDINRDALRLQSPEGRTLKRVRDSLEADFGFNLHDQSTYYNAERTEKPATISYLAPAYNYEKEINDVRADAMRVIVFMNSILQKYAPGQVGRYNDDFEPRAFGDNIQKWGTSTILIESGGFRGDPEKQHIRKLNYVSILSALLTIADGSYKKQELEAYEEIPHNDRKLFDLKINQLTYNLLGEEYVLDVGIHQFEVDNKIHEDFWYSSRIADQGDLSTFYGYETLEAQGFEVVPARVYEKQLSSQDKLKELSALELLKNGYGYVRVETLPKNLQFPDFPLHLLHAEAKAPQFRLDVGLNPTFFLKKGGTLRYAVINGFLVDLAKPGELPHNGLIYR